MGKKYNYIEDIIINGIQTYMYNETRYIKQKSGYRLVCSKTNCSNSIKINGLCRKHNTELIKGTAKQRICIKRENLDETKITINGIDIYVINNIKYRKNHKGTLVYACKYENCNKFAKYHANYEYCMTHINGTDPNSPERLEQAKINKIKHTETSRNNLKVGDDTEDWLCKELQQIKSIHSVERIGYTGHKLDIRYKYLDEIHYRGIQVKTLILRAKSKEAYNFKSINDNYDENTLFVCINKERTRFVILFSIKI